MAGINGKVGVQEKLNKYVERLWSDTDGWL